MLAQVVALTLAGAGYFFNLPVSLILGGYACIFVDIYGVINKRIKPAMPVVFYVGGFLISGMWLGILYGAIFHNCVEIVRSFIVYLAMISKKKR